MLQETLDLYLMLDTIKVGTIILRNDLGWTVTNGHQNIVGTSLKVTLKQFLQKEQERKIKK
jgi:hypothetical protein